MADGGNAHLPAPFYQLDDHPGSRISLSRSRRPLDRKHGSLARQPLHKTPCGFCQAPVIADQGIDDNFQRAGTFTKQQVTFRLKFALSRYAMIRYP